MEYSLFFVILSGAKNLIPHRLQGIVDKEQRAATEPAGKIKKAKRSKSSSLFAFYLEPIINDYLKHNSRKLLGADTRFFILHLAQHFIGLND